MPKRLSEKNWRKIWIILRTKQTQYEFEDIENKEEKEGYEIRMVKTRKKKEISTQIIELKNTTEEIHGNQNAKEVDTSRGARESGKSSRREKEADTSAEGKKLEEAESKDGEKENECGESNGIPKKVGDYGQFKIPSTDR